MAFAVASIWLRPLWPVDETRYAGVAWEMWLRGDFLVPYLNGEPYSHKPPLLFWLIHLGWALFGVNDWWPRLVAPLCALGSVPLLLKMERLLWGRSGLSPWILFGTLLFAAFITLTMMDLLLMLCAMAGMIGVLNLSGQKRISGLLWLGAGIGLGVLAKGPVILLHVLPAALVAPWWAPELKGRLGRSYSLYYLDLLLGVLLGAAIALAWAVPAAWAGGETYREAIFWGQTAGRVADSFAHRAPWWYYLPLLPLILFPWFVIPRFWTGLGSIRKEQSTRFLAAWLVLTLVVFSLVSGKQAKYLLPCLPGFALLAGRALAQGRARGWDLIPPALGLLAASAFLAAVRASPEALRLPAWASGFRSGRCVTGAGRCGAAVVRAQRRRGAAAGARVRDPFRHGGGGHGRRAGPGALRGSRTGCAGPGQSAGSQGAARASGQVPRAVQLRRPARRADRNPRPARACGLGRGASGGPRDDGGARAGARGRARHRRRRSVHRRRWSVHRRRWS
jgi:4-amino-4-deoxy-L-arabinose transferase-like glycosyltransferase